MNCWCNYCGDKVLCDDENCEICFNKSFASHNKAQYWNTQKNKLTPRELFKFTAQKGNFICESGHEFEMTLNHVSQGCWCTYCINKTETKLKNFLINNNYNIIEQYKANWCKNKTYFKFDFYLPDYNLIIECDGLQHFQNIKAWKSDVKRQQIRDAYKIKCANANNIIIIRIYQNDIWNDENNWQNMLINSIKIYENTNTIYLSNKYKKYQQNINKLLEYSENELLDMIKSYYK